MSLSPAQYKAVQRGFTSVLRDAINSATPYYPQVSTVVNSSSADEGYLMLGSMPGVREWIGDRQFKELTSADFSLKNKHWESSVALERTRIDDDRYGMCDSVLTQMGNEAAHHPDELIFDLIANGHQTTCWDGQYFYDSDHVWRDSGTQSNLVSVDVATPTAPTSAEIKTAFHAALRRMKSFKMDNGKFFIRPRVGMLGNMVLHVPLAYEESANKAFEQMYIANGESNYFLERPQVVTIPYLGTEGGGSDAQMYLHYTGAPLKPFIFQNRMPLRAASKGAEDMEFKDIKFMTEARYNCGYLAWMYSIKITLT